MADVVITGIGLVTPLGRSPAEALARIAAGEVAAAPSPLASELACQNVAQVLDFDAERYFPENKNLLLMNRDAEMAVVAARLALRMPASRRSGPTRRRRSGCSARRGFSGMPADQITRLVEHAAAADGSLDLERFGRVALRRIRPVLSFKILSNMPICFVSIFEGIRGPNAVYCPGEGPGGAGDRRRDPRHPPWRRALRAGRRLRRENARTCPGQPPTVGCFRILEPHWPRDRSRRSGSHAGVGRRGPSDAARGADLRPPAPARLAINGLFSGEQPGRDAGGDTFRLGNHRPPSAGGSRRW